MTIFEAFQHMERGKIVSTKDGMWYRKGKNGHLQESYDFGENWQDVDEFAFGMINDTWAVVESVVSEMDQTIDNME